jgi:hypothetical protein
MAHNRATLYSNGIADFQRTFSITGGPPNKISIPVRQQHLADVLASLTVSGNVRIVSPPSFQPSNHDDGNLVISTVNSFTDLAHQLAGAGVEILTAKETIRGKLVGVQDQESGTSGEPITDQSLVLLNEKGLSRIAIRQIENLYFTDEAIRTEIKRALDRRLRDIKPNSTLLELELSTTRKESKATIQYTIPAAAWKISYRMILAKGKNIAFHGYAIVDNNTDEDWVDFVVSVVMGQPITFSTDLAESKTPHRYHVNVVQDSAIGSIEVESAIMRPVPVADSEEDNSAGLKKKAASSVGTNRNRGHEFRRLESAEVEATEVSEIGDFCVFESAHPVSIEAHRSAIIPVFQTTLKDSKSVLHFNVGNHAQRPFRAIRFHNTTEHSLSRGVCTVFDQKTYVGNCILPVTAPGGVSLLPHALETEVRVLHHAEKIEARRIGVRIVDGVVSDSFHKLQRTEYTINSQREEAFTFVVDHPLRLSYGNIKCQLVRESVAPVRLDLEVLSDGRRAEFELLPRDVVKVVFVETCVAKSQVCLVGESSADGNLKVSWLYDNLIESNTSLAQEPEILRCIELQRELEEIQNQISHANDELKRLICRQQRLRENIRVGVNAQQTARWHDDLARAEDMLVQLEEVHCPKLVAGRDECRRALYQALKNLMIDWSE